MSGARSLADGRLRLDFPAPAVARLAAGRYERALTIVLVLSALLGLTTAVL